MKKSKGNPHMENLRRPGKGELGDLDHVQGEDGEDRWTKGKDVDGDHIRKHQAKMANRRKRNKGRT